MSRAPVFDVFLKSTVVPLSRFPRNSSRSRRSSIAFPVRARRWSPRIQIRESSLRTEPSRVVSTTRTGRSPSRSVAVCGHCGGIFDAMLATTARLRHPAADRNARVTASGGSGSFSIQSSCHLSSVVLNLSRPAGPERTRQDAAGHGDVIKNPALMSIARAPG